MARMIITYRVMPKDGEVEYSQLKEVTEKTVKEYDETVTISSIDEHDVGFGIKAVKINFSVEESKGSENLENELKNLNEVADVQIEAMSRAMG